MFNQFETPTADDQFLRKSFSAGTTIIEEGQEGHSAFLITKGKVEIRTGTRSNNPKTVAVLSRGDVFGELAMFDGSHHMATAIAQEPTHVLAITRSEFDRRMAGTDPVIRGIIMQIVKRARGTPTRPNVLAHLFG